jgi:hypothetical protein
VSAAKEHSEHAAKTCFTCGAEACWEVWLAKPDAGSDTSYACGAHARGHLRRALDVGEPRPRDSEGTWKGVAPPPRIVR